ncbi:uncharacterized protein A4U43_C08F1080 [Asparagus officinalis]|uniref:uncharacterized protein LOC109822404 n=1 Tax=Asparagus officinalis TaxID=4686 RepID=UPI00098E4F05|nr:uncharacterized protein LOC109822404 [Asparagus officinalis]ONK58920.1 uncharacterized protein A4U43_C08F1080 [Asparagus officinalis]
MQRCFATLRRRHLLSSSLRLLSPSNLPSPVAFPVNSPTPRPRFSPPLGFHSPFPNHKGFDGTQIRCYAAEESGKKTKSKIQRKSKSRLVKKRKKKERSRAPRTPETSKLKKYKIKGYSSFKYRFRPLNDGTIRRWRAGKLHNAHAKSKKSKRRLRKPETVHLAYAKVMKKLNFCN